MRNTFFFHLIFIIQLLLLSLPTLAQNEPWSGVGIEANVMYGKMIKHNARFTGPIPSSSYSAEINIFKKTYGQKEWHQRRNYPQIGVSLYYNNYNLADVYGQVIGIAPNIQIPIIKRSNLEWSFRIGMGIGYVTKPFERVPKANLQNTAIGGHWNNLSPFSTDLRYTINAHWDMQLGINFSHVSNAAFQQPNLGINMYGAHVGLRYFPVTSKPEKIVRHLEPLKNRWLFQARLGGAFIESVGTADGALNPVYIAAAYVSKRYWSKNKVYAGLDYHYNSGVYTRIKIAEHHPGEENKYATQIAAFVGNEFLVGRLGILLQAGYYFQKLDQQQDNIYQKLGGNFYFIQKEKGIVKEAFFSAILKTHMASAELFEMGLGIGL
jgi:hypothetical protein